MDVAAAERWMREALQLAHAAAAADEVPVGAVVVRGEQVIGRGQDRRIELRDPTAHAEVLALREAAQHLGDWRLEDCTLVVTLEPCPMCAGAALLARVPLIVYGARNPKFGAVETQVQLLAHTGWNHSSRTIPGILEPECGAVMSEYFRRKRNSTK
jgi:tRNA(adenine34) deaminase